MSYLVLLCNKLNQHDKINLKLLTQRDHFIFWFFSFKCKLHSTFQNDFLPSKTLMFFIPCVNEAKQVECKYELKVLLKNTFCGMCVFLGAMIASIRRPKVDFINICDQLMRSFLQQMTFGKEHRYLANDAQFLVAIQCWIFELFSLWSDRQFLPNTICWQIFAWPQSVVKLTPI